MTETLLEKQLNDVPVTRVPRPVEPAIAVGIMYNAELQRLVRAINIDVKETLLPVLKSIQNQYIADSWVDTIVMTLSLLRGRWINTSVQADAVRLANRFVNGADKVNRTKFNRQMKSFGLDIYGDSLELQNYIQASIIDNTNLITSIPERYLQQVESIIMTNTRVGNRPSAIARQLTEQFGVESRRAKFIARDQSAKLAGDLNKERQRAAGIIYFKWLTSKDQRVRDRHSAIANKMTEYGKGVYRWDKPPLSDEGVPIIPGQDYQCRCTAIPVTQKQVDSNKVARV